MRNHIVVINSSAEVLEAICQLLSLEGYQVSICTYRQDPIAEIRQASADLIILDYVPKYETRILTLFDQLKSESLDSIPVIVTSVQLDIPAVVRNEFRTREPEVLIKPFGLGQLLKAVRAKLTGSSEGAYMA